MQGLGFSSVEEAHARTAQLGVHLLPDFVWIVCTGERRGGEPGKDHTADTCYKLKLGSMR